MLFQGFPSRSISLDSLALFWFQGYSLIPWLCTLLVVLHVSMSTLGVCSAYVAWPSQELSQGFQTIAKEGYSH